MDHLSLNSTVHKNMSFPKKLYSVFIALTSWVAAYLSPRS